MKMPRQVTRQLRGEDGFGLVESLIALTILVIGLVAVSGLSLASADQARIANWRSQQTAAAQMVLEELQEEGWAAAASHMDTVTIYGHPFPVKVEVSRVTPRVKAVTVGVAGVGELDGRVFRTRLYKPRPLPEPISP